jgi:hypothetical protein
VPGPSRGSGDTWTEFRNAGPEQNLADDVVSAESTGRVRTQGRVYCLVGKRGLRGKEGGETIQTTALQKGKIVHLCGARNTHGANLLVFITEMKIVYSAVRTGSLNNAVCACATYCIN